MSTMQIDIAEVDDAAALEATSAESFCGSPPLTIHSVDDVKR